MSGIVFQVKAFPTDDGSLFFDFDKAVDYIATVADAFGCDSYPSRRDMFTQVTKDKTVTILCGYANRNRITLLLREVI